MITWREKGPIASTLRKRRGDVFCQLFFATSKKREKRGVSFPNEKVGLMSLKAKGVPSGKKLLFGGNSSMLYSEKKRDPPKRGGERGVIYRT